MIGGLSFGRSKIKAVKAKRVRNLLGRDFGKQRTSDKLTIEKRSSLMAKIRSRDSRLEQQFVASLRNITHKSFQTNVSSIKGRPDIVFQESKVCVFLDSDFWHGWYYPRWKHLLKNNFWLDKIENNRKRDRKTTIYLRRNGWIVLRFWEHDIKNCVEESAQRVDLVS